MSLVTVQRSPTPSNSLEEDGPPPDNLDNKTEISENVCDSQRSVRSLPRQRSLASECYFAVKGAALILPQNECVMIPRQSNSFGGEIQLHLQAMLHLLRAQDTLKMAVRLENLFSQHTRYMAIISTMGRQDNHESILLGIDYVSPEETTIGLMVPIWASTQISLDGDGGISVESNGSQFLFKPMSVQAMWSAFQSLHKEHDAACSSGPYFPGGLTHTWVQYYEARILSKEAFRSAWHYVYSKEETEVLKADSMQRFKDKPPERAGAEKMIRQALKIIMQSVDLDEVTSKDIREKLEDRLHMNLTEYKEFVDQEMLIILGQMDQPSQVFPHLYLGTEWNASNWDELKQNNVGYILNVTKEVDNFFPGMFYYMKIRVSDEESTELLRHWDLTYKFITKAKENNSAVLVHCKKGISRSSSTVVAYAMKSFGWSLREALTYVKEKRDCITPNKGFMEQLRTYQGILEASQHRNSALFNQSQTTPATPDLVPWSGLIDEYVEEERPSASNLMECQDLMLSRDFNDDKEEACCQIYEKNLVDDSDQSPERRGSTTIGAGQSAPNETPPTHRLLVASENILKSAPPPPPPPFPASMIVGQSKTAAVEKIDKSIICEKSIVSPQKSLIKFSISIEEENMKNQQQQSASIDNNKQKIDNDKQKIDNTTLDLDDSSMPDFLNLRLPVRRRLKNVEKFQAAASAGGDGQKLPTLKNVQEILMRKNLHIKTSAEQQQCTTTMTSSSQRREKARKSASSNQKSTSTSDHVTSISASDSGSSLTVSSSGDEEEESDGIAGGGSAGSGSSGTGHVMTGFLNRRRNSKSSSGDSAVADLLASGSIHTSSASTSSMKSAAMTSSSPSRIMAMTSSMSPANRRSSSIGGGGGSMLDLTNRNRGGCDESQSRDSSKSGLNRLSSSTIGTISQRTSSSIFGNLPKSPLPLVLTPFQRPRLGTVAGTLAVPVPTNQDQQPPDHARMRRPASYASGLVPAGRVKRFTRKYEMKNRGRSSPSLATMKNSFDQSEDDDQQHQQQLSDRESSNSGGGGAEKVKGQTTAPPVDPAPSGSSTHTPSKKSGAGRKLFERFFPPSGHHLKKGSASGQPTANFQSFV